MNITIWFKFYPSKNILYDLYNILNSNWKSIPTKRKCLLPGIEPGTFAWKPDHLATRLSQVLTKISKIFEIHLTIFPCFCRRCRQSKSATIDNSLRKVLIRFLKFLFNKISKYFYQIIKKLWLTGLRIVCYHDWHKSRYQKLL